MHISCTLCLSPSIRLFLSFTRSVRVFVPLLFTSTHSTIFIANKSLTALRTSQRRKKWMYIASVERMRQQSKFDSRFVYRMHNKILVSDFPREMCILYIMDASERMTQCVEQKRQRWICHTCYGWTNGQYATKCSQSNSNNEYPFVWTLMVQTHQ